MFSKHKKFKTTKLIIKYDIGDANYTNILANSKYWSDGFFLDFGQITTNI